MMGCILNKSVPDETKWRLSLILKIGPHPGPEGRACAKVLFRDSDSYREVGGI